MEKKRRAFGVDEEPLCIQCLKKHLQDRLPGQAVEWEPGDDPPDFWLLVGESQFAVEVTSLVERIHKLGPKVTSLFYWAQLDDLARDVGAQAVCAGVLRGTYCLYSTGDPPLPRRRARRRVIEDCVTYIRDTKQSTLPVREAPVWTDPQTGAHVSIVKAGEDDPSVEPSRTSAKWGDQERQEVRWLLEDTLSRKRRSLEAQALPDKCSGAILALFNAYPFLGSEALMEQLGQVGDAQWFHSIFLVQPLTRVTGELETSGCFLHTKEPRWADPRPQRA